ncbi:hypothetical protein BJ912DRAFT_649468 [Pholiota molesta]|nr:hypothetical protein BJ912DRAFT_649468 [Pholiota molesta]
MDSSKFPSPVCMWLGLSSGGLAVSFAGSKALVLDALHPSHVWFGLAHFIERLTPVKFGMDSSPIIESSTPALSSRLSITLHDTPTSVNTHGLECPQYTSTTRLIHLFPLYEPTTDLYLQPLEILPGFRNELTSGNRTFLQRRSYYYYLLTQWTKIVAAFVFLFFPRGCFFYVFSFAVGTISPSVTTVQLCQRGFSPYLYSYIFVRVTAIPA